MLGMLQNRIKNAERGSQEFTAQPLTVPTAKGEASLRDNEAFRWPEPDMELISKFLSSEWQGIPAAFWILAGLILLVVALVVALRVPICIIRRTKKSEFILETKPTSPERKRSNGRRKRTR